LNSPGSWNLFEISTDESYEVRTIIILNYINF